MQNCVYCNLDLTYIENKANIGNHIRWCKLNPNRTHNNKLCNFCGKEHSRKRSKYCSVDCGNSAKSSEENRKKISDSRKKFLKENPDKHPWKNKDKFVSHPCESLKQHLKSRNIVFVEEWMPLEDRFYSIDIAFPDIKLGIEVNGNQHYNSDGTLKDYYKKRHDLIVSAGWVLIELHYSMCYNFEYVDSIIENRVQPDYSEYFAIKELKKNKNKVLPRGQKIKQIYDLKWEEYKEKIIKSGIDFSKFGWVKEVAEILGLPSQNVNKWMKRYLPDFYEKYCFKRKQKKKRLTKF